MGLSNRARRYKIYSSEPPATTTTPRYSRPSLTRRRNQSTILFGTPAAQLTSSTRASWNAHQVTIFRQWIGENKREEKGSSARARANYGDLGPLLARLNLDGYSGVTNADGEDVQDLLLKKVKRKLRAEGDFGYVPVKRKEWGENEKKEEKEEVVVDSDAYSDDTVTTATEGKGTGKRAKLEEGDGEGEGEDVPNYSSLPHGHIPRLSSASLQKLYQELHDDETVERMPSERSPSVDSALSVSDTTTTPNTSEAESESNTTANEEDESSGRRERALMKQAIDRMKRLQESAHEMRNTVMKLPGDNSWLDTMTDDVTSKVDYMYDSLTAYLKEEYYLS